MIITIIIIMIILLTRKLINKNIENMQIIKLFEFSLVLSSYFSYITFL